ncbi:MAG: hypothetical protein RLZZ507_4517 [Cyanobacteriota bacterium]|jgi:hypothetical protein
MLEWEEYQFLFSSCTSSNPGYPDSDSYMLQFTSLDVREDSMIQLKEYYLLFQQ